MNALPKLLKLALLPLLAASLNAASTYKVQSGDTLSSIARKNGTTASKLMSDNGISDPNKLMIGQVLKIGSSATPKASTPKKTTSTPPASKSSGNYSVKSGETLYSIARNHGMSVSQLTSLNPGLDPSKLSVGQKIVTKGTAPDSKPKAKTPPPAPKPVIAKAPAPQAPAPSPTPVLASTKPVAKPTPAPAPQPKPLMLAEKRPETPSTISSVMVSKEISFGALASKHRTSTKQLNELNGWSLKPTTVLAKGSEIYVPGS